MLTLIISTPRSGSNTFAKSLDGEIWIPKDHPGYKKHYELFNFKPITDINSDKLIKTYHAMLLDYVRSTPTTNVIVKVLINTVSLNTLKSLIKSSDILYHTIRYDYTSQLKSLICAKKQNKWLERPDVSTVHITQEDIDSNHTYLSKSIEAHSKIYSEYGGELHILEERESAPYKSVNIVGTDLSWPCFSTREYFK